MEHETWERGVNAEITFWRRWFETKGLIWPEEYRLRQNPLRPLDPRIGAYLPVDGAILDVGAGPLTVLGKQWDGRPVRITAVDPLAKAYDQLLEEFGITPLVRTQEAACETLATSTSGWPAVRRYDIVHAMNAIDHSRDPITGIRQMIEMARPGGHVILSHATREATRERHSGMHQWDFYLDEDGQFIIEGEGRGANVSALVVHEGRGRVVDTQGDDRWHWVVIEKSTACGPD
jgi:SAM-dependent methyltransferase